MSKIKKYTNSLDINLQSRLHYIAAIIYQCISIIHANVIGFVSATLKFITGLPDLKNVLYMITYLVLPSNIIFQLGQWGFSACKYYP